MRAERRQDMGRAIEQGIGGRENPDGVRKGMPVKCKKPLKKRLRSFRKGRRVIKKTTRRFEHFHCCSTIRVKRLGRFYWRKDNENILNGKEILNLGNGVAYFQISSLSQSDGKPIAAVSILG